MHRAAIIREVCGRSHALRALSPLPVYAHASAHPGRAFADPGTASSEDFLMNGATPFGVCGARGTFADPGQLGSQARRSWDRMTTTTRVGWSTRRPGC